MDVYHNESFLGCVSEKPVCSQLFYGSHYTHLELWNKNRQKIVNISGPCYAVSCGEISFMVSGHPSEKRGLRSTNFPMKLLKTFKKIRIN